MPTTAMLSRRMFLEMAGGTAAVTLLTACGGPPSLPVSGAATAAPASASGARKQVLFWGRQQFLPDSNDYLTESVKLAGMKGGFDVSVQLFSNDEHPQKEVVAMESGVVPVTPIRWPRAAFFSQFDCGGCGRRASNRALACLILSL